MKEQGIAIDREWGWVGFHCSLEANRMMVNSSRERERDLVISV